MTIRYGTNLQASGPEASPLDLRDTAVAGRIHEVDPEAVAKFKAFLAGSGGQKAEGRRQKETAVVASSSGRLPGGVGFNNRLPKREAVELKKEYVMAIHKNELTDDQVRVLHGRYLAGEKPSDLAIESCLVNRHELMAKFQKLGLPSKNGGAFGRGTVRKETKTAAVPPTAVAPIAEVAETAVSPVTGNVSSDLPAPPPANNGRSLELTSLHDQLAAVQQLMEMAQAQSVQVSGTILLNLVIEITL